MNTKHLSDELINTARAMIYEEITRQNKEFDVSIKKLADVTRAAIESLPEPPVADVPEGWLPIRTAPLDGSPVDVFTQADGRVPCVRWTSDGWCSPFVRWHGNPTHWRELPPDPQPEE